MAKLIDYVYFEVEAEDEDRAREIAEEAVGGDFHQVRKIDPYISHVGERIYYTDSDANRYIIYLLVDFNAKEVDVSKYTHYMAVAVEDDPDGGAVSGFFYVEGESDEDLLDCCERYVHKKERLNNNFLVTIVDNLEDWLDDKGVRIPNEERDEEDSDNCANIYGDDFDCIMEMMRDVCRENGIIVDDKWED